MDVSWPYIAGFFDGEGCVRVGGRGVMCTMAQAGAIGKTVLSDIQGFMLKQGVMCQLYVSQEGVWSLNITSREALQEAAKHLLPLVRVKKVGLQDLVRFIKIFPSISRGPRLGFIISERKKARHG